MSGRPSLPRPGASPALRSSTVRPSAISVPKTPPSPGRAACQSRHRTRTSGRRRSDCIAGSASPGSRGGNGWACTPAGGNARSRNCPSACRNQYSLSPRTMPVSSNSPNAQTVEVAAARSGRMVPHSYKGGAQPAMNQTCGPGVAEPYRNAPAWTSQTPSSDFRAWCLRQGCCFGLRLALECRAVSTSCRSFM